MDYKDWIQNRAEELAQELYSTEFYELPENIRAQVYNQAYLDYTDHYAAQIDAAYDRALEARLFNQSTIG